MSSMTDVSTRTPEGPVGAARAPSEPFTEADLQLLALPGGGHRVEIREGTLRISSRDDAPLTIAQLDSLPDDRRRHELVAGVVVVTPAPAFRHQQVLARLYDLIRAGCPAHLRVYFAPLDNLLPDGSVVEPDLMVLPRAATSTGRFPDQLPVLVAEILSPSTRRLDTEDKFALYAQAGIPHYWVGDPDGPSIAVWQLREGRYAAFAHVTGDQPLTVTEPFPITLTPAQLLD